MPGVLYIVSVMSAGLLSVLMLALRAEKTRCKAVDTALAKLAGIRAERRLSAGRRALAVDDRNQVLCLICAETQTVRLNVVPFADLLASELWLDGQPVSRVERGSSGEAVGRRSRQAGQPGDIRLRIETRDRDAPVHELHIADLRLAKYWQSQLRVMIAASQNLKDLAAGTARRRTVAAESGDRRATVQPGIAGKPQAVRAADRTQSSDIPSPQLRAALRRFLAQSLPENGRLVISERKLRDACAPELALIRFHEQMNRLRRAKALRDFRLSYTRKTESWRISRADERRAAA